jgi:hypothetical protein
MHSEASGDCSCHASATIQVAAGLLDRSVWADPARRPPRASQMRGEQCGARAKQLIIKPASQSLHSQPGDVPVLLGGHPQRGP